MQLSATGAALRWYERSIQRRFDEEVDEWAAENTDTGFTLKFGVKALLAGDPPFVRVRVILGLDEPDVSAVLDCGVEFRFEREQQNLITRAQAIQFIKDQGMPYVLGLERGVLADLTREVGLPATLIPPRVPSSVLDDIEAALVVIEAE